MREKIKRIIANINYIVECLEGNGFQKFDKILRTDRVYLLQSDSPVQCINVQSNLIK